MKLNFSMKSAFWGLCILSSSTFVNANDIDSFLGNPAPVLLGEVQLLNPGAWMGEANGPSIYNKGDLQTVSIPAIGNATSSDIVNVVNYDWDLSYSPVGLTVYLCHENTTKCIDVTSAKSGSVRDLTGERLAANKPWLFAFTVAGSGEALLPVAYGRMNKVIVNYE